MVWDPDIKWVPSGEAAVRLQVTRQRISQLAKEGKLASRTMAGRLLISSASIEARLAKLAQEGEQDACLWEWQ